MNSAPLDRAELSRLLLDAVQKAGQITTRELTGKLPAKHAVVNVPCSSSCRRRNRWSATETVLEHHSTWHRIQIPHTRADIYRPLRALEAEGRITRQRSAGERDVRWCARPEQLTLGELHPDTAAEDGAHRDISVRTRVATNGGL
ncbi:hypothetical protein [Mycobacteroides abscessus]|uniref:hypothetical protein n=1 Tax=Mycobacteroides abscessus TaxID=36809 RepID=UPI0009269244|nr:hypothetical protein [Mycobacteroides abscessus]SHY26995.1 Uncharacterised protein [Mycobacteroides abscessus subsp. abscessus]SID73282.1 Uncharacterised protein [Mycobacteroides abscessus subsp. abscessus]SIK17705.1 Uncharacterised protein [Mycobacteroides abscessus subsp. abscessus]SIM41874.1 Uncharacterised protein [Mycobacteroides abscessus subsp. abscessus]SKM13942.1 Uncharacterised protein [Mycobacteroides abscessus subsp. massiliense]